MYNALLKNPLSMPLANETTASERSGKRWLRLLRAIDLEAIGSVRASSSVEKTTTCNVKQTACVITVSENETRDEFRTVKTSIDKENNTDLNNVFSEIKMLFLYNIARKIIIKQRSFACARFLSLKECN